MNYVKVICLAMLFMAIPLSVSAQEQGQEEDGIYSGVVKSYFKSSGRININGKTYVIKKGLELHGLGPEGFKRLRPGMEVSYEFYKKNGNSIITSLDVEGRHAKE